MSNCLICYFSKRKCSALICDIDAENKNNDCKRYIQVNIEDINLNLEAGIKNKVSVKLEEFLFVPRFFEQVSILFDSLRFQ